MYRHEARKQENFPKKVGEKVITENLLRPENDGNTLLAMHYIVLEKKMTQSRLFY
jgi:hypothetical protein